MTSDDYDEAYVGNFRKTRGSVRGVLSLAAQLLLPIEGLCSKLTYVPIQVVSKIGTICLDALKEPTRSASPSVVPRGPLHGQSTAQAPPY